VKMRPYRCWYSHRASRAPTQCTTLRGGGWEANTAAREEQATGSATGLTMSSRGWGLNLRNRCGCERYMPLPVRWEPPCLSIYPRRTGPVAHARAGDPWFPPVNRLALGCSLPTTPNGTTGRGGAGTGRLRLKGRAREDSGERTGPPPPVLRRGMAGGGRSGGTGSSTGRRGAGRAPRTLSGGTAPPRARGRQGATRRRAAGFQPLATCPPPNSNPATILTPFYI